MCVVLNLFLKGCSKASPGSGSQKINQERLGSVKPVACPRPQSAQAPPLRSCPADQFRQGSLQPVPSEHPKQTPRPFSRSAPGGRSRPFSAFRLCLRHRRGCPCGGVGVGSEFLLEVPVASLLHCQEKRFPTAGPCLPALQPKGAQGQQPLQESPGIVHAVSVLRSHLPVRSASRFHSTPVPRTPPLLLL